MSTPPSDQAQFFEVPIGRRFKNDTERLEKLFEMYTKMTTKPKARA